MADALYERTQGFESAFCICGDCLHHCRGGRIFPCASEKHGCIIDLLALRIRDVPFFRCIGTVFSIWFDGDRQFTGILYQSFRLDFPLCFIDRDIRFYSENERSFSKNSFLILHKI